MRGRNTPGPSIPGDTIPGPETPGPNVPDEQVERTETISESGVAIDALGETSFGNLNADRGTVEEIRVNADASDFNFNILVAGDRVFSSTRSPSGTSEESFEPDQNLEFDDAQAEVRVDITSASATAGATATFDVDVAAEE